jgi:hypothetical protein
MRNRENKPTASIREQWSLYIGEGEQLNDGKGLRVGDRSGPRVKVTRASAWIPTRAEGAYQPEQSPGPNEPASCARKGRRPRRRSDGRG